MALGTAIQKINKARAAYEGALNKLGKTLAKEVAAHLGAAIPEGFAIEWTQGTPGYNDGEPCTFGVNDPLIFKLVAPVYDPDNEIEETEDRSSYCAGEISSDMPLVIAEVWWDQYGKSKYSAKIDGLLKKDLQAITRAWRSLGEDVFKQAFGDGAAVRVYSDGSHEREDHEEGY